MTYPEETRLDHQWEGPSIGDRECVVCGMSPRIWDGEECPGFYPVPSWVTGEPRKVSWENWND